MKSILRTILNEIESGPVKWIASVLSIIATIIILLQYNTPHYYTTPPDNLTSDGINSLNNNLDTKESEIKDLVTGASQAQISSMETPAIKKDTAKYSDVSPLITSYPRTNEYTEYSSDPSCAPKSKQATCPSKDSCVDCDGACWSPGNYGGGKTICSNGMWTIKESSSDKVSGYARTNEYSENSLDPFCVPGSKQTICPFKDSCVDCDGACWSPGNYRGGKTICSNGMWTIKESSSDRVPGYTRTNEYSENSLDPFCVPGSKQTTCPSKDSCVDCDGACWSPGNYGGGKTICSNGMWTII